MSTRQPAIFLPHGGGPWPFVDLPISDKASEARLTAYLQGLARLPSGPPAAVLVISAHWEEDEPTVMTAAKPELYFDYYGFPAHTYRLKWPAPGAPKVASRVRTLLEEAGQESQDNSARGFDHGTFVPLMLTWPEPTIPVTQLSLKRGLDPVQHLAIGRALEPLREEGVLIIGSGMSFHNMRAFGHPDARGHAKAFDDWLGDAVTKPREAREAALAGWERAPSARLCHPREEHLLPLMVVAGAAGGDVGSLPFRDEVLGVPVSAVHFG